MELTNEQKYDALMNAIPQEPRKEELGGGIYYKCHWMNCDNTVHPWDRYCSKCGQKLRWPDDYDEKGSK